LRRSGRCSVTTATGPSRVTASDSKFMAPFAPFVA
jgi:hypothetical protein